MGVQCDEEIITGVDKLLHLVNEKQKLSLTEAANELGVDRGLVEEWTDMLEQDELIAVRMNLWEQHLVSTDWHDENVGVIQMLRSALRPTRHLKEHELKERCRDLRQRERKVALQMRTINKRLKDLKRYERLKERAEQAMKDATDERKRIGKAHEDLEKERFRLEALEKDLRERSSRLDERMEKISESEKLLADHENDLKQQRQELRNVLEDLPKIVDDLIENRTNL